MQILVDEYGLVGYPLGHSFSQLFFKDKFEKENINAVYLMFEISKLSELKNIMEKHKNLKGFNVTIPYKTEVLSYLDSLTDEAAEIGAVNTVKVERKNGQIFLKGYNTDVLGFMKSLNEILDKKMHTRALVLGTGGASKAVCYSLAKMGIPYIKVSRRKDSDCLTYSELSCDILNSHHIIINCTPLGTFPNVDICPDIPYECLSKNHLLYDLVYNPSETLFLKKGKEMGAVIKNGYEMLQLQAIEAWQIWIEQKV